MCGVVQVLAMYSCLFDIFEIFENQTKVTQLSKYYMLWFVSTVCELKFLMVADSVIRESLLSEVGTTGIYSPLRTLST